MSDYLFGVHGDFVRPTVRVTRLRKEGARAAIECVRRPPGHITATLWRASGARMCRVSCAPGSNTLRQVKHMGDSFANALVFVGQSALGKVLVSVGFSSCAVYVTHRSVNRGAGARDYLVGRRPGALKPTLLTTWGASIVGQQGSSNPRCTRGSPNQPFANQAFAWSWFCICAN